MNWSEIGLVIFDADGTLRQRKDELDKAPLNDGEWELVPGIEDAIDEIRFYPLVFGIASNQACVGRGEVEYEKAVDMLFDLNSRLRLYLTKHTVRVCPHTPEENCICRKPKPSMLEFIMRFYDVDPESTVFVGNTISDRLTAENAKCRYMSIEEFLGKE